MAELLLVNPRKRRAKKSARKSRSRRRNPIAAARRPARNVSGLARRRVSRRRRNPVALAGLARRGRRVMRRRRNPIGLGGGSFVSALIKSAKEAAIGGAGAIAVDAAMGQINRFLPASMQRTPGRVGVGDAVKLAITVALGRLLSKPTRGLSTKMAQGALTVQAHGILSTLVPSAVALGYAVPGRVVNASARVGPMRNAQGMNAYAPAGSPSPMLNAYTRSNVTPLLSGGVGGARRREGAIR